MAEQEELGSAGDHFPVIFRHLCHGRNGGTHRGFTCPHSHPLLPELSRVGQEMMRRRICKTGAKPPPIRAHRASLSILPGCQHKKKKKKTQRISHSVMEAGILIWAPLVLFIYLFIWFSRSLLLLMYYLYSRKLDSEDSSILQISFLILSIKNAQAAGALAGDELCRSESCPWSSL